MKPVRKAFPNLYFFSPLSSFPNLSLFSILRTVFIVAAVLCLCPLRSLAQNEPALLLKGTIHDATTGEPIPYATIVLAANNISTLSNDEGQFIFKIPVENKNDSLFISHIGYHTLALTARDLDPGPGAANTNRIIRLQQAPTELPGITVRPVDAWQLLQQAIDKVPNNYPTSPFVLTGFYRVDATVKRRVIELSEAVFTIYSPDGQRRNMQFRLIRARSDRDLTAFDGNPFSIGRRPDAIMDRDMLARIHQTQILGDEGHNDHEFAYAGLIDYEGRPAYEIHFDQKAGVGKPLFKGRIIIDTANLAFLCFDYGLSPRGLRYRGASGPGPFHNEVTASNLLIQYRRYGNKYYLHQVRTTTPIHSWFDGDPSGGKLAVDYDTTYTHMNYLVTRIDTGLVAFSRVGRKIDNEKKIELQIKENSGVKEDAYWDNYNLIEADYNVDSALAAIRANNARTKKR